MKLEIEALSQTYPAFTLGPVAFKTDRRLVALIGPNGAGKSTLMAAVAGILPRSTGTVTIDGADLDMKARLLRTALTQSRDIWYHALSFADHLVCLRGFYPQWSSRVADDSMRRFALDPRRKTGTASAGMLAKFALVVALARRADLILLDEPWNALDFEGRVEFSQILRESVTLTEGAFIISSHDLRELETICDYVVLIRKGQIVVAAPAADVLKPGAGAGSLADLYLDFAHA